MINEESQKQLLRSLEKIQYEKNEQINTLKIFKHYSDSLQKETQKAENKINNFFDEKNKIISELNEKLQMAIQENDKDTIIKIVTKLEDMK